MPCLSTTAHVQIPMPPRMSWRGRGPQPNSILNEESRVEGLDEIVWWVLGYGPHAVVREPAELAARVAEMAQAMAARYGGGAGS